MSELVVATATLILKPDASSGWESWLDPKPDPELKSSEDSSWKVGELGIRVQELALLVPRSIKFNAVGSVTPGKLTINSIDADDATLSKVLKQGSAGFLLKSTTGKFSATVDAAAKNNNGDVLPSVGPLTGTWSIADAKQEVVEAS